MGIKYRFLVFLGLALFPVLMKSTSSGFKQELNTLSLAVVGYNTVSALKDYCQLSNEIKKLSDNSGYQKLENSSMSELIQETNPDKAISFYRPKVLQESSHLDVMSAPGFNCIFLNNQRAIDAFNKANSNDRKALHCILEHEIGHIVHQDRPDHIRKKVEVSTSVAMATLLCFQAIRENLCVLIVPMYIAKSVIDEIIILAIERRNTARADEYVQSKIKDPEKLRAFASYLKESGEWEKKYKESVWAPVIIYGMDHPWPSDRAAYFEKAAKAFKE